MKMVIQIKTKDCRNKLLLTSSFLINYIQDQMQLLMLQQQYAQEIPEVVKNFIIYFHRNILENNVYELHGIYENSFNRLTEKFYAKSPWPEADYIAPLVNDGNDFLVRL